MSRVNGGLQCTRAKQARHDECSCSDVGLHEALALTLAQETLLQVRCPLSVQLRDEYMTRDEGRQAFGPELHGLTMAPVRTEGKEIRQKLSLQSSCTLRDSSR